ncbi:DNA cytosine methyltransferase [Otariodibacter oris]|uniref:Cytosine-specific methyltransferase n=1 Tax=Otariodibacter oris TaxID=1032623 RepID=A0A420XI84_9PAST|nr:DNA cytosine methyltransferase [Otariodibacter oris]QGM80870.1 DNA (cytosine-5-)-methyltransferase [Otariodibacter oris]RKR76956.1 DNA (cytosine-5)-methyltransferase 1 [Otariodibacter oris]
MLNTIELFAGCGGLLDGFEQTQKYNCLAAVEWQKPQVNTLINRLENKYQIEDAKSRVLYFDIQRTTELIHGWNDNIFGDSLGLDSIINKRKVDIITGGPPCQAYSIAGRARDVNNMKNDYRNFLFESYIAVVAHYRPKLIIFENVEGILSAIPTGEKITTLIQKSLRNIGYEIIDNMKENALLDLSEFGIPQNRKRVIIIGIRKDTDFIDYQSELNYFYKLLNKRKIITKLTVRNAIGDLPPIYPLKNPEKRVAYNNNSEINGHISRFHSQRDQDIFYELAKDIENGTFRYSKVDALIKFYYEKTGKETSVHKYYVLRWDEQSNTIPAHLKKDGLRHIHPDALQKRSITVREAARLQTFDDDFFFNESMVANFEMIGNAVPPKFAKILAETVYDFHQYLIRKES